jgi:hypothetical protein
VIRAKLGSATIVQGVNPLGSALEQMLGAAAARLTAWQQAIVAAVFELCLVGVMVIYELLGHVKQPAQRRIEGVQSQKTLGGDPAKLPPPQGVKRMASPSRRKESSSRGAASRASSATMCSPPTASRSKSRP